MKQGDRLITIDPDPYAAEVERSRAQVLAAEARVAFTRKEQDRAQRLQQSNSGAISDSNVDQRVGAYTAVGTGYARAERCLATRDPPVMICNCVGACENGTSECRCADPKEGRRWDRLRGTERSEHQKDLPKDVPACRQRGSVRRRCEVRGVCRASTLVDRNSLFLRQNLLFQPKNSLFPCEGNLVVSRLNLLADRASVSPLPAGTNKIPCKIP